MIKAVLSACLSLWLVLAGGGNALAAPGHLTVPAHRGGGAVITVADSALGGMDEIFHMDPPRLLFLGVGIVAGAALISPSLGISELFGVVLGIIGSEFLYHTTYVPSRSYYLF